jgi:stage III sporulation protein AA
MVRGAAQNDIGLMTDVLDGYSRAAGILTALRVLSPVCIVCDEISTPEDAEAVLQASGCGVRFAASCHAGTVEDLRRRPVMRDLLSAGVFQYCVLLESGGRVKTVRRLATL